MLFLFIQIVVAVVVDLVTVVVVLVISVSEVGAVFIGVTSSVVDPDVPVLAVGTIVDDPVDADVVRGVIESLIMFSLSVLLMLSLSML